MQHFVSQRPVLILLASMVWIIVMGATAIVSVGALSGWRSLAERYRTKRNFPAHRRNLQSARMRKWVGYNNCLTAGSDAEGLYLGVMTPFGMGHPRLLIPWMDVEVEEPTRWLWLTVRTLRLGPDRIPLRIRESLAGFLLEEKPGSRQPESDVRRGV